MKMDETIKELTNTIQMVESFLSEDRRCRNSDKWLTYQVMIKTAKENGYSFQIPFDLFKKLPAFDSIRRTRQKLQAEGKYPPTDEVVRKRRARQKKVKQFVTDY